MSDTESPTDPNWSEYPATVLEIHSRTDSGAPDQAIIEVDLRVPLDRGVAERLRRLGLGETWAIVTAYNPRGRRPGAAANAACHARLEDAARELGVPFLRADGRSPDASHREVGLAVGVRQPEAVALARQFGQSAIFWFDGEAFWLVPALASAEPMRLPGFIEGFRGRD